MKANEFVKKFGWDWAKEILSQSNNCGLYVDANLNVTCHQMINEPDQYKGEGYVFHRNDLKRLVESHELVEELGGIDKAIIFVLDAEKAGRYFGIFTSGGGFSIDELKQAIADVESCQ